MTSREEINMKRCTIAMLIMLSIYGMAYADVDLTVGTIRLVITDFKGSVSLYREAKNRKFIPLFDSKSFTRDSTFYVLLDKSVYNVDANSGFRIESSFEGSTATMICTLENKVNVTMRYTLFSSVAGNPEDSVKVSIEFTNLAEFSQLIGIKSVFDTWLGEHSGTHFTTVLSDKLSTEYYFTDIRNDLWVQSANEEVSVRFLLAGEQVTQAQTIAIANKNVFSGLTWSPILSVGRGFDSLQSYNNSALLIIWQPLILDSGSVKEIHFYISTAAGKDYPVDIRLIGNNPIATTPFSDYDITEIRRLLAIIHELDTNSRNINREEILQLNAEVDLMLEKIGR